MGKSQSSGLDSSERPVVTFKENIKPREQSRIQQHRDGGKERVGFGKGNGMPLKNELKKDGKRKSEVKKNSHEKVLDVGKQVRGFSDIPMHFLLCNSACLSSDFFPPLCFCEGKNSDGNEEDSSVRGKEDPSHPDANNLLLPVYSYTSPWSVSSSPQQARYKQTPTLTCTNSSCPSKSVYHCLLFPPGFPPPAYVIPPPVAFSMNPGFTFPPGVSVPTSFLQPASHPQSPNQVQSGKPSHIPYSQQRPSGPGSLTQGPPQPQALPQPQQPQPAPPQSSKQALQQSVQLQVQQQSPTKQNSQLGKSPPHHTGMQQVPKLVIDDRC